MCEKCWLNKRADYSEETSLVGDNRGLQSSGTWQAHPRQAFSNKTRLYGLKLPPKIIKNRRFFKSNARRSHYCRDFFRNFFPVSLFKIRPACGTCQGRPSVVLSVCIFSVWDFFLVTDRPRQKHALIIGDLPGT